MSAYILRGIWWKRKRCLPLSGRMAARGHQWRRYCEILLSQRDFDAGPGGDNPFRKLTADERRREQLGGLGLEDAVIQALLPLLFNKAGNLSLKAMKNSQFAFVFQVYIIQCF